MKTLFALASFMSLYILFWLITTPITLFKIFIEALTGNSEDAG